MTSDKDIQDLRERLARLEEEFALFKRHYGAVKPAETAPDEDARIIEQIENANMMEAIKIHQQIHHSSTAEAKEYVTQLAHRLGKA